MTAHINSDLYQYQDTPKAQGFVFPAEWEKQDALWLSWPHKEESWPGKIETIYEPYSQFIKLVAEDQLVRINVADEEMKAFALSHIEKSGAKMENISFYLNPTNDAWCRDHGPAFVINRATGEKAVVDWGYNAWGGKYPPFDLDDVVPTRIAKEFNLKLFTPPIVMEGGSVEFNGKGTILTTSACLLNENRNPHLNKEQIETYLKDYYGQDQVLWLGDGIVGDDTDGHIDDITRFVSEDTVLTVVEEDKADDNYELLQENLENLKAMKLLDGRSLNVIELPMPRPVEYDDQRLPASYANFYIANKVVIVPVFNDKNDSKALEIIQSVFPDRKVIGIDSVDIIWGLGSFHCLSQQEPSI
ncbi:agmatine deiminase [Sphingobacterium mizutaii NBRC 14946 = DSM 11724]|uniref:Agmatine deiminase n=2 Tax=Sphingobacterium mizutaii TaxID=1010 RepID=A0AAJ4XCJ4_9SPHI|nr:agmatine deiminase family protein [Sphingobacterium mizutaii]GEM67345.1 agmatine deiminase [Sphingobacterium mizutaii NBRC 14946 = DSM 11724]SDL03556.1 agmatine deiminase [Sphingobacterium mizutaii]SNV50486.1 Putative agmatine deiminase [Sphingobacterium mizutaii]